MPTSELLQTCCCCRPVRGCEWSSRTKRGRPLRQHASAKRKSRFQAVAGCHLFSNSFVGRAAARHPVGRAGRGARGRVRSSPPPPRFEKCVHVRRGSSCCGKVSWRSIGQFLSSRPSPRPWKPRVLRTSPFRSEARPERPRMPRRSFLQPGSS